MARINYKSIDQKVKNCKKVEKALNNKMEQLAIVAAVDLSFDLSSSFSAAGIGTVDVSVGDIKLQDGQCRANINFNNLHRDSLSTRSGGLDNVVVAFKTGWDIPNVKEKRVSGVWHGTRVMNKLHRDPLPGIVMDVVNNFSSPGVVDVQADAKYQ